MQKMRLGLGLFVILVMGTVFVYNYEKRPVVETEVDMRDLPVETETGSKLVGQTITEKTLTIGSTTIQVELADTVALRTRGLSGRGELPVGYGMLFVFPEPGQYGFWMKDMQFSLDLIFLNEDRQVVSIYPDLTPESYPASYGSNVLAQYVLEIPAGQVDKWEIKVGDQAVW